MSQWHIGIDLGTTHCALAAVRPADTEQPSAVLMDIPQLIAPGQTQNKALLPSFVYLPHADELSDTDGQLPWGTANAVAGVDTTDHSQPIVVGQIARQLGVQTSIRLVASAKSWLSHTGVDRRSAVLPAATFPDIPQISPVCAAQAYLEHLQQAWDYQNPESPLAEQDITLTVPASFDPTARELTVEAANTAGLRKLRLLEEPQAALYGWLDAQATAGQDWRDQLQAGDQILVIDIGGGTLDLSLINAVEEDRQLRLERVAVGDHILLGGDNMDLALAQHVRQKLGRQGSRMDNSQLQGLIQLCRDAKEKLLADPQLPPVPIVIANRGARLLGGSMRSELSAEEVHSIVLDGFFPAAQLDELPQQNIVSALTQLGLPYAQDAGISRHLAQFLNHQQAQPTHLLLNGGVCKSQVVQQRLLATLNGWMTELGANPITLLDDSQFDTAVALGAASYGYYQAQGGMRIRSATAQSFYVGVQSAMPAVPGMPPAMEALCIAPQGMDEGTEVQLPQASVAAIVGQPVQLRCFTASDRADDQPGDTLPSWALEELHELNAIELNLSSSTLAPGSMVPVRLQAAVDELGILRLSAQSAPTDAEAERWQVEFATRD